MGGCRDDAVVGRASRVLTGSVGNSQRETLFLTASVSVRFSLPLRRCITKH